MEAHDATTTAFSHESAAPAPGDAERDGHTHTHDETDRNGHTHAHDETDRHAHTHAHGGHHHIHSDEEKKAVTNRLARAIGHLESVRAMVERDEDCSDVLIQLAAVRSALNGTANLILKNHIASCIVEAVAAGDMAQVDALNEAIDKFMKS